MSVPAHRRCFGTVLPILTCVTTLSSFPCSSALAQGEQHASTPPALSPELQRARAGLEKYQDPVVAVHDASGRPVAQGLAEYGADEVATIKGRRSEEHAALLGYAPRSAVIHRDQLVLL